MKVIINLLLVLLIAFLAFMLYNSIKEPIAFERVKEYRKAVVVKQLTDIRTAQEIYRSINGTFASDFDSLAYSLMNDSIPIEQIIGDPDDPTNMDKVIRTVTYLSAKDSIMAMNINVDSLKYVPFTNGKTFEMKADTMTYQSTLTDVVEVKTYWKDFMGEYASKKYTKYDNLYDPERPLKFGDLYKPTLSGNWR